jgi:uridylate kinase
MAEPAHKRVILKLSGEVLGGTSGAGLDPTTLHRIAVDLVGAHKLGITIGVVVGGGNFIRGAQASGNALSRADADAMGMLATVINALALEAEINAAGGSARTLSALAVPQVCESYSRQRARKLLAQGHIVIFAGGTGNPYFTTDTTAVLRGAEMDCDAVLKATNVDGVYSADPKRDPKATRYERLTHQEAIDKNLKIMDGTAFALARENRLPIIVFSILDADAITSVLSGRGRATIVSQ